MGIKQYLSQIDCRSPCSSTALHFAMDVNSLNDDGETPLHWACKVGSTEIVKYLLTHGASINAMDENGDTPLHWAAEENHTEVAELLLKHKANLNSKNILRETPYLKAKSNGSKNCASFLQQANVAKPNSVLKDQMIWQRPQKRVSNVF